MIDSGILLYRGVGQPITCALFYQGIPPLCSLSRDECRMLLRASLWFAQAETALRVAVTGSDGQLSLYLGIIDKDKE